MKNLFLLNRSGMSPEVTCRKGRYSLDPILSRLCVVSLIYANKLLNHRTTPLGRFVLPEHLPFSKPKVNWLLHASLICLCMLTIGSGNVWGASVTYQVSTASAVTVSAGTAPAGSSATLTGTGTLNSGFIQCTGGQNKTLTLSGYKGYKITGITIHVKSNSKSGSGSFSVVAGSTTIASIASSAFNNANWNGSWNNSGVNKVLTMTNNNYEIQNGENVTFTLNASANSLYIKQWIITYEAVSSGCAKKVTISKGTPETGGSFDLDKTGEQDCCSALTVTVSNITAPSGKVFSAITQSGIASGVTIDQSAKTVTYAANSTGSSTINVTYEDKGCTDHGSSSITSSASTSYTTGPIDEYYKYSTRQILYTKSDLGLDAGKKGTIKSIYFKYAGGSAMSAKTSVDIYLANTSLTALASGTAVPYSAFTKVYSGPLNFTAAGWQEFSFNVANFDYDGVGCLAVMIDDNSYAYDGTAFTFNVNSSSGAQIYKHSDTTNEDPSTINWSSDVTATNERPNAKFCIQEADMTPATVTLKDNDATLTEASAGAGVTLPSRAGCSGYTFAGWTKSWVTAQTSWTTTAPTIIPAGTYYPTADEDLYPVYTKTEGEEEEETEIFATTSLGSTNTVTTGYAVSAAAEAKSGYYQDGSGTTRSVSVSKSSTATAMISSIPTIATVTAKLGGGTTKDPLTNNVYAVWLDASGNELGDAVQITSKITNTTGSDFTANLPVANATSAYGVRIKHQKETSYNVRYYAISLSITTGGSTTSYISVPGCCTDWSTPTVTYSSSLAINASEGVTIGSGTTHGAVTYESSDEDVLTVDTDGTIHAVGAGTAHIIATWAGETISSTTYCEKSANSNDVTVSGIQVTGTTPVNFGQVYQNAVVANKTIYVTGLGLAKPITPSLPAASPFSFSPASLAANSSGATLTISANTATLGNYNQTLTLNSGAFSATVTVKMEVIAMPTATFTDALHGLTEDEDGVSLSSYNLTAAQGTPVVFPTLANQTKSAGTCEGEYYIFVGWTEGDNNTDPEAHLVTSYTLANGDTKNYYAVWADASGSATYTKLTSDAFKTSPTKYVLGGEDNGTKYFLYTYSSTDADLSWGECSSSEAPIQFTLSGAAGTLVAQDASGNYLAESSAKKKFRMSSTSATVQLQDDGTIETEYFYLRYNHNSGSGGLRYYESDSSEPAYFYEVSAGGTVHYRTSCCANKVDAPVVTATAVTSTSITLTWPSDVKATGWQIEWNGAGGWVTPSGSCTHTVSGLTPNTTYTWRVRATYEDPVCGADVRSGSTTTNQVYHVTYAKGSGTGTCTATGSTTDETGYEAGATVTLQANGFSLSGHTFAGWTEDDDDITISSNQFTMPDHDVVITASWTAKMDKYFDRMHDQTDALHGGVEETEGTNEGKYYIPKEGCNYSVPTAVDSNTGDACQTSHYKLRGWIAASYVNSKGEITDESKIFSPTSRPTWTATGATYYAVWAEVTE